MKLFFFIGDNIFGKNERHTAVSGIIIAVRGSFVAVRGSFIAVRGSFIDCVIDSFTAVRNNCLFTALIFSGIC